VYVVNKSDELQRRRARDLNLMLQRVNTGPTAAGVASATVSGEGGQLWEAVAKHRTHLGRPAGSRRGGARASGQSDHGRRAVALARRPVLEGDRA
jgi:hypothetical protein